MKDEVRGFPDKGVKDKYWYTIHHAPSGTKIEGFSYEPDYQKGFPDKDRNYWYQFRFTDTESPAIRQWMEEKDFNYLNRIRVENPALFKTELAELKAANPTHPAIEKIEADIRREQQQQAPQYQQYQPPFQQPPQAYPPPLQQQQGYGQQQYGQQPHPSYPQAQYLQQGYSPYAGYPTPPQQQQYPQAQHQQTKAKKEQDLERELAELREKMAALEKQQASSSAPLPVSAKEDKKAMTPIHKTPSLSDDTMQQMALIIRYEDITLTQKIGEGAFGLVSQGRWHYEEVAVKKLHLQKMSADSLEEFQQEAAIMARLRSDYIVVLKGITLTPYSLVMEYMRGGSLFDLLHDKKIPLEWHVRHRLAQDIAMGLYFLHRHEPKILHRDLKSHNVLLTEYQRAKLADFGLSKVRVESSRSQTQSTKKSVGTIPWMAPECFGIRPKYSEKSDMYAYGMVLWEIASRQMPYEDVTDADEIRAAVKDGEREEIPEKATNPADPLPTSYKELIKVCWFQAPNKRPSAKEAIEMLNIDQTQTSSSSSSSSSMSGFFGNFSSKQ